ncbi:MAG: (d)CMP kinase [Gammaproteobacteria bacterium]|nr:(d)CMP kinase [Gammaproteobacteria bacterium]
MSDGRPAAPVIAIDGPSGSGKGTIAARVAERLGWRLLDSGALYRIVAWAALARGIPLDDPERLAVMTRTLVIEQGAAAVRVDGVDVTAAIREERISVGAAAVATLPEVRQTLRGVQQGMRVAPGLVADGRDMGTEVFRDAELKIFLDASVDERARRRHKQLMEKGSSVSLRDLFASIQARDRSDRNRAVSPLRRAPDAISIDTTQMSVEAVVAEVLKHVETRGLAAGPARSRGGGQEND